MAIYYNENNREIYNSTTRMLIRLRINSYESYECSFSGDVPIYNFYKCSSAEIQKMHIPDEIKGWYCDEKYSRKMSVEEMNHLLSEWEERTIANEITEYRACEIDNDNLY
ncbi:MAG: hypothetical protein CV087_22780 [Candidatus Brocadia sp. WS118]|nr:MAG: hypothetical protein CV087_22780 [Candidatus Brocadia sp. WS118]